MPKCIFRQLTGFQCPGCGAQRAVYALLHGNIMEAVACNVFFVVAIPFLLLTAYAVFMMKKGNPSSTTVRLYNFVTSRYTLLSYVAVYCIWWVVRNCIGCWESIFIWIVYAIREGRDCCTCCQRFSQNQVGFHDRSVKENQGGCLENPGSRSAGRIGRSLYLLLWMENWMGSDAHSSTVHGLVSPCCLSFRQYVCPCESHSAFYLPSWWVLDAP